MLPYQINQLARKAAKLAFPTFVEKGWTYYENEYPSEDRLFNIVRNLIESLVDSPDSWYTGSGRFTVIRIDDDIQVSLDLGSSFDEDVFEDKEIRYKESAIEYYKGRIKDCEKDIEDRLEFLYNSG